MKKAILTLVIVAVVTIVAYKSISSRQQIAERNSSTAAAPEPQAAQNRSTFYLFHNPSDQDEGCRRIYSFADQAERELAARVEVKRPDVKAEKAIVDKYQVRVLPTILLVSPDGQVAERFEGEDGNTIRGLESMMARLRATL